MLEIMTLVSSANNIGFDIEFMLEIMTLVSSANNIGSDIEFMLEIMTLVSSANNIDFDIEFIQGGRTFIYIMALELILGDLHISVYPSQRKYF
jgi:hypothetical protein